MVPAMEETSASRTSSRGRKPAIATPSGISVGRSLAEWTAASTSPARRAASISLVNRPLPPASASGRSWIASPLVRMILSSMRSISQPCASARRRRVSFACASASGEPRVPRMKRTGEVMDGACGSIAPLFEHSPALSNERLPAATGRADPVRRRRETWIDLLRGGTSKINGFLAMLRLCRGDALLSSLFGGLFANP